MKWFSNMLPEEKRLYSGVAVVVLLTVAAFIGASYM
jgi:hypothetical protein